jgi:hypothetical protein
MRQVGFYKYLEISMMTNFCRIYDENWYFDFGAISRGFLFPIMGAHWDHRNDLPRVRTENAPGLSRIRNHHAQKRLRGAR